MLPIAQQRSASNRRADKLRARPGRKEDDRNMAAMPASPNDSAAGFDMGAAEARNPKGDQTHLPAFDDKSACRFAAFRHRLFE